MMYRNLLHYIISPWVVALAVSFVFILLVPFNLSKYETVLMNQVKISDNRYYLAHDFDHDMRSEKIQISLNYPDGTPHIVYRNHLDQLLLQWNLRGEFISWARPVFGDYDKNGNDEFYIMTFVGNKLAVNAFEPFLKNGLNVESREICNLEEYNGFQDWRITQGGIHDLDGDGYGELLFSIYAGFTLQPRAQFVWDIHRDSIFWSPVSGTAFTGRMSVVELAGKGNTYIAGSLTSTNNYSDHPDQIIDYPDTCGWLMIFDRNLQYFFEPEPVPGHPTSVWTEFVSFNDSVWILVKTTNTGIPHYPDMLALYDLNGNRMYSRSFENPADRPVFLEGRGEGPPYKEIIAISRNNEILKLHRDLSFKKVDILNYPGRPVYQPVDLNPDGINDFLWINGSCTNISIYPYGYSNPVVLDLGTNTFDIQTDYITVCYDAGKNPEVWVSGSGFFSQFRVSENLIYPYRHLYFVLVYAIMLGFIFVVQKLYAIRRKRMEEIRQKMILLELKSIKNRMSPHFIFNVLSTLSNQVLRGDKMKAYESITTFSGLLRETLDGSEKYAIQLKDELSLAEKFIKLQRMRFSGKFDYNIVVDDNVNIDHLIPRSTVMTFVENAIKHGLFHKPKQGLLSIRVRAEKRYTIIEVEDNGIGRVVAAKLSARKAGQGLSIINEYFAIFNRQNFRKLTWEIIDLYDDWQLPAGTLVRVRVPLGYKCIPGIPAEKGG